MWQCAFMATLLCRPNVHVCICSYVCMCLCMHVWMSAGVHVCRSMYVCVCLPLSDPALQNCPTLLVSLKKSRDWRRLSDTWYVSPAIPEYRPSCRKGVEVAILYAAHSARPITWRVAAPPYGGRPQIAAPCSVLQLKLCAQGTQTDPEVHLIEPLSLVRSTTVKPL